MCVWTYIDFCVENRMRLYILCIRAFFLDWGVKVKKKSNNFISIQIWHQKRKTEVDEHVEGENIQFSFQQRM